jgi:biotin operon repressor
MANNFKVSGKKLTSRFGMSHRLVRMQIKSLRETYPGYKDYPTVSVD